MANGSRDLLPSSLADEHHARRSMKKRRALGVSILCLVFFLGSFFPSHVPPDVPPPPALPVSTDDAFPVMPSPPKILFDTINKLPASVRTLKTFTSPRVSAYTSHAEQTDDTPCIAASGLDLCAALAAGKIRLPFHSGKSSSDVPIACASNDFALGSRLWIKGLGVCKVVDRMNTRYSGKRVVDIYFGFDYFGAKQFGIRRLDITILD